MMEGAWRKSIQLPMENVMTMRKIGENPFAIGVLFVTSNTRKRERRNGAIMRGGGLRWQGTI